MSVSIHNNSITFVEGPLVGKIFHPLWLRERLNDKKNLDPINLQRLYEPSLIDISISIKEFSGKIWKKYKATGKLIFKNQNKKYKRHVSSTQSIWKLTNEQ